LFWPGSSFEYAPIKHVVERFNQISKTAKVEVIPYSQESTYDLLSSNNELKPDLIALGNTAFMELKPEEIEQYLQPIVLPDPDSIYPAFLRAYLRNGQLYSAPITFTPIVLAYNKSLFNQAGEPFPDDTWDLERLLTAAKRLTQREGNALPHSYGFSFSTSLNRWPALILANGGRFDELMDSNDDNSPAFKALNYTMEMMYTHKVAPLFSASNGYVGETLFTRGKVAMILTSYNFMGQFNQIDFDWEFCAIPSISPACRTLGISSGISIAAQSNKKEAAMSFVRFVLSDAIQAYLKLDSFSLPVVKHVASSRKYPHNPFGRNGYYTFEKLMDGMQTLADCSLGYEEWILYQNELNMAWAGTVSVREALTRARELAGAD
jgi:multiple sugar transport system substrate-binding protein